MSVINTGSLPKSLWPGIKQWWGNNYEEHPMEYEMIFDMESSDKQYEEDVQVVDFGLAPRKNEGASVIYDTENQGYITRYTNFAYGLGYIVTREEIDDNLYETVTRRRTQQLAFSMRQTRETVSANVLNRGFTTNPNFAGGDGQPLFSGSHPVQGGGTQSNLLSPAADLSETAVENLVIQVRKAENDPGLKISLMPRCLIVPPDLSFEAERIVNSVLQSNSANNDINAIRSMGVFPDGIVVNHYLIDNDAWFIKTNAPRGMMFMDRIPTEFSMDNDFDTENMKYKAYMRFSVGWTDWRGCYGSAGAA